MATLEQIQQTLNQPVFYGIPTSPAVIAAINKARPFVADREQAAGAGPRSSAALWIKPPAPRRALTAVEAKKAAQDSVK